MMQIFLHSVTVSFNLNAHFEPMKWRFHSAWFWTLDMMLPLSWECTDTIFWYTDAIPTFVEYYLRLIFELQNHTEKRNFGDDNDSILWIWQTCQHSVSVCIKEVGQIYISIIYIYIINLPWVILPKGFQTYLKPDDYYIVLLIGCTTTSDLEVLGLMSAPILVQWWHRRKIEYLQGFTDELTIKGFHGVSNSV